MHYITEISDKVKDIELRQNPIIITVNEFTEESAQKFHSEMCAAHNSGQKVVPVEIDSYGGQVYSLMSMIGAIKSSRLPVATIVQGKAMSCGAILASFGSEGLRFMDKDATMMIHDVSSYAFGKIEELKADAREAERLNDKVYTMMARNCGKPDDYFTKIIHDKGHADWFLDAEEAKEHKLIDQIRMPELIIKVSVDIDLE
jgi:ATP-dependent Clp endopeptidase proteolytic subunit ClpP